MKRLLFALLIVLILISALASAQTLIRLAATPVAGNMTTSGDVIAFPIPVGVGFGSLGVEARGTWTGTVAIECAASFGGGTFVALNLMPRDSTTAVTSVTANGQWSAVIAGCQRVQARATAAMTGTVTITMVGVYQ